MSVPTYIYKLVPDSPESPIPLDHADLPEVLPVSEIDRSSGFIHLSTASQLPNTLAHFFTSDTRVGVLRLPYDPLARAGLIRWESPETAVCGTRPGEGTFPHLYNGLVIGRKEIEGVWVLDWAGDVDKGWAEAIDKDRAFRAWLVY